jgi:hypothetical protein
VSVRIFDAQVDVAARRADREPCDGHALDQRQRVPFHQHAIGKRARIALVGIACDVLLRRYLLEDRPPLDAGGEGRAASSAESRVRDFLHHLLGLHR